MIKILAIAIALNVAAVSSQTYVLLPKQEMDILDQIKLIKFEGKLEKSKYESRDNPCDSLADLSDLAQKKTLNSEIRPLSLKLEWYRILEKIEQSARRSAARNQDYAECRLILKMLLDRMV